MRELKNLMFFKCGYPQSKKIVNEAEVFSFINYFYLVIYIITRGCRKICVKSKSTTSFFEVQESIKFSMAES